MRKTIVYLAHGDRKFHDQTRYSVLTLLAQLLEHDRNDFRVVVYTDRADELPLHDLVRAVAVSPAEFAALRGPLDYVHRVKLGILRRAVCELGDPLIYVDSDTRWRQLPDAPFDALSAAPAAGPAPCYLYKVEGTISARLFPQYLRLLQRQSCRLAMRGIREVPPWTMWNSGTVGIPRHGGDFIDEVLRVNDELLPYTGFRNCVEQLALSLVAAARFDVRCFDAYLEHWWSYGSELPVVLGRFFDALPPGLTVGQEAARAAGFRIDECELRAIQARPANRFARWRDKMHRSLYKRRIDLRAAALRRRADP